MNHGHEGEADVEFLARVLGIHLEELGGRLVEAIDHREADLMRLPGEQRITLAKKLCEGTSARVEG